jgi:hypothetical protein
MSLGIADEAPRGSALYGFPPKGIGGVDVAGAHEQRGGHSVALQERQSMREHTRVAVIEGHPDCSGWQAPVAAASPRHLRAGHRRPAGLQVFEVTGEGCGIRYVVVGEHPQTPRTTDRGDSMSERLAACETRKSATHP